MRAKSASAVVRDVRYDPIDSELYPEFAEDGGTEYHRFWCRPEFIVYEKYRNGVKLGYVVFPGEKEIFLFEQMVRYAESIRGQVLCRVRKTN